MGNPTQKAWLVQSFKWQFTCSKSQVWWQCSPSRTQLLPCTPSELDSTTRLICLKLACLSHAFQIIAIKVFHCMSLTFIFPEPFSHYSIILTVFLFTFSLPSFFSLQTVPAMLYLHCPFSVSAYPQYQVSHTSFRLLGLITLAFKLKSTFLHSGNTVFQPFIQHFILLCLALSKTYIISLI